MRYYFAPMEGITTALYRNLHHRFFPGMDQYYTPFLSPARDHVFSKRDLQEILPEHQEGVPVVPQLLTKYPEDFIWAAGELAAMGAVILNPIFHQIEQNLIQVVFYHQNGGPRAGTVFQSNPVEACHRRQHTQHMVCGFRNIRHLPVRLFPRVHLGQRQELLRVQAKPTI